MQTNTKMKVEIWSDIMCPFCYIGKRNFEMALSKFEDKEQIEVIWKSFQLSPDMKTDPSTNINQFLAKHKGISVEQATQLNDRVTQMAAGVGLKYDFNKAIVANSFNAHRFLHLSKQAGVQTAAKEKLMAAYFTEGKNIDSAATLTAIGEQLGLKTNDVQNLFAGDQFAVDVEHDTLEARQLGINGVPFFVFNRKYAVSGAQPTEAFAEVLNKSFAEFKQQTN